jgi:hypothetical protein
MVVAACSWTWRVLGKECLDDGYGITCEDLNNTAEEQGVTLKRGDYVIVRTGQMERCLRAGSWDVIWWRRAGLCLRDARMGGAHRAGGARQRHLGL